MAKKKDLKTTVEEGIQAILEDTSKEPSDGRLKALALGIKMCALNAKLEESEYGDFFDADDEPGAAGGIQKGTKHPARGRANGTGGTADPAA